MNITELPPYDRIFKIHDEIGRLLRKRRLEKSKLEPANFPVSKEEQAAWTIFTAPENLELLNELFALTPPTDKYSRALWMKAIAECSARIEQSTPALVAAH